MFASIAPLVRLPGSVDVFDYYIPDELAPDVVPGSLVTIPFRARHISGVVLGVSETHAGTFRARPISSLASPHPLLSKGQLALIARFSEYYYVPRGLVARMIVPDKPKRRSKNVRPPHPLPLFLIEKQSAADIEQYRQSATQLPDEIRIHDLSSVIWFLREYCAATSTGVTILAPTIAYCTLFAETLSQQCPERVVAYHSELNKNQQWNVYGRALTQHDRILVSTRQGALLPIPERSSVLVFDSTNEDFKQTEQHPRYDGRTIAQWHAEITDSSCTMLAHAERILVSAPDIDELPGASAMRTKTSLSDMKKESGASAGLLLTYTTYEQIKKAKDNNQRIVVASLRHSSDKGISVQSIYEELTKTLKNCTIGTLNLKTDDVPHTDIIVCTTEALESEKLLSERGNIGLLVIASIEPLLALPDFRSAERAYYKLSHLKLLAQELRIPHCIVQSYGDENQAIRAVVYGERDALRTSEHDARSKLQYPPFVDLIKISHKKKSAAEVKTLAARIPSSDAYRIQGPYTDYEQYPSLLIKMLIPVEIPIIRTLGSDWIVDREPENIL